jgi:hypothetical protein
VRSHQIETEGLSNVTTHTIKGLLIDPAAHSREENAVTEVQLATEPGNPEEGYGTQVAKGEHERVLGVERVEYTTLAKDVALVVPGNDPGDGSNNVVWCWTWNGSVPVPGKALIYGHEVMKDRVFDCPISERGAWTRIRFAPRRLKGTESFRFEDDDAVTLRTARIAPIVDEAGNDLLIPQTFLSGKPLIPNDLAEQLFANWTLAAADSNSETPNFPDGVPVVKLFFIGGWDGYIYAVDPASPRRAYGAFSGPTLGVRNPSRGIIDLDDVASWRMSILPVERDLYIDLDKPLSHYARELKAAA